MRLFWHQTFCRFVSADISSDSSCISWQYSSVSAVFAARSSAVMGLYPQDSRVMAVMLLVSSWVKWFL